MYLDSEFYKILSPNTVYKYPTKMRIVVENLNQQIVRANVKLSSYNSYRTTGFTTLLNTVYRGCSTLNEYHCKDDTEALYTVLELIRQKLSSSFDCNSTGGRAGNRYFIANRTCHEYIFSVAPRDPRRSYPLNKGKDYWRKYRPFRLIDVDSSDFTLYISSGLLHYTKDLPKFALYSFDPVAACLQYNNLKDEISLPQYIHQYLIMPALTLDNIRLWLLGVYNQWFVSNSRSYTDIPMVTASYIHIPLSLDHALRDISDMIENSRHGGVNVNSLLSSLPLPFKTNVPRYATLIYNKSSFENMADFTWGTFMIYRRLLDVCIRAMSATINNDNTKTHVFRLARAMQILSNTNMLSGIADSYTRHFVKASIDSFYRQIMDLKDKIRNI